MDQNFDYRPQHDKYRVPVEEETLDRVRPCWRQEIGACIGGIAIVVVVGSIVTGTIFPWIRGW